MFSKPVPPASSGADVSSDVRRFAASVAVDVSALTRALRSSAPWLAAGSCVGGGLLHSAPVPKSIRTTVHERRKRGIHTTVEEGKPQVKSRTTSTFLDSGRDLDGKPKLEEGESRLALLKVVAETVAPALLLYAPLKLLSPWGGLAGVAMAAGPCCGSPPPATPAQIMAAQQRGQMSGVPGLPDHLKQDDEFADLIFPGFKSDAFIWHVTCWQIAEFALSMCLGHQRQNPTSCVLYQLGASWGPAVAKGEIWRLVTPMMLHANLTHLVFNLFFQLRMGFGMERQFGRDKMMAIYIICGIFGNLLSVAYDPFKLSVGASTAGFGLIGVWLAEILLSWELLGPAKERTLIWIAFMLISVTTMSSMTPNMDLVGHLGGALGGFLLSIAISDMREEDRPSWYSQARIAATAGLFIFFAGSLGKIMLFTPHGPIPNCDILSTLFSSSSAASGASTYSAAAVALAAKAAATQ